MSDRGSILISTANDIGEALVEKLGGEGYAPSVWDKEYNKLGIAEVDSAPALSVLENSSETGTARGSILMSTANTIGAMLNKKYNTDRGFKPKEWASAGRKMKALETDTKSGSIVNIQGAKETPLLSLVATISPTSSGVSSVTETQTGKNWINNLVENIEAGTINGSTGENEPASNRCRSISAIPFPFDDIYTNYTMTIPSGYGIAFRLYDSNMNYVPVFNAGFVSSLPSDGRNKDVKYMRYVFRKNDNSNITPDDISLIKYQLEIGSVATTYEPYKDPTTYTADLGETVYGGNVDFISGELTKTHKDIDLGSLNWTYHTATSSYVAFFDTYLPEDCITGDSQVAFDGYTEDYTPIQSSVIALPNQPQYDDMVMALAKNTRRLIICDQRYSSAADFTTAVTGKTLVYPLATPTESSITPIDISTSGDVENYYTSAGDTSIEYYAVPTPYTRGTASGAIDNVQSARTDLPFTKVKANIAPNLTGVESVEVTKCGLNLFDKAKATVGKYINVSGQEATNEAKAHSALLPLKPSTTYYMSGHADASYYSILALDKDMNVLSTWYGGASKTEAFTATTPSNARWCYLNFNADQIDTMIFAESSSPVSYVEYNETVYTADLGEPVYGGSVDLVSGEVKEYPYSDLGTRSIFRDPNRAGVFYCALPGRVSGSDVLGCNNYAVMNIAVSTAYDKYVSGVNSYGGGYIFFRDTSLAGLSDAELTEALTGTLVSFDNGNIVTRNIAPQVIVPSDGVNNLWNNAGGDTDVEYFTTE